MGKEQMKNAGASSLSRRFWLWAIALAAVVALGGGVLMMQKGQEEPGEQALDADAAEAETIDAAANAQAVQAARPYETRRPARQKKAARKEKKAPRPGAARAPGAKDAQKPPKSQKPTLSEAEEKAIATIEDALDTERLEKVAALIPSAGMSGSAQVRLSLVEALGFFGKRALPELTAFLGDGDEDVRTTALNEWTAALDDVENEQERMQIAEKAVMAVADEDSLEDIFTAYLGFDDEGAAAESLVKIIEGDGTAATKEKAKETYSFITGEDYTTKADAEFWIRQYRAENAEEQSALEEHTQDKEREQ